MTGTELIAAERKRQIEVEGFTADYDAAHQNDELVRAAVCYAICDTEPPDLMSRLSGPPCSRQWPWHWKWWKPRDRVRNLVKAGALIAAEIDRLQNQKDKP